MAGLTYRFLKGFLSFWRSRDITLKPFSLSHFSFSPRLEERLDGGFLRAPLPELRERQDLGRALGQPFCQMRCGCSTTGSAMVAENIFWLIYTPLVLVSKRMRGSCNLLFSAPLVCGVSSIFHGRDCLAALSFQATA